ncbi:hypothetical protein DLE60_24575 [Micromonospora globispora]|uniref:Uncharacterized protein n=1 Tax=Micromonospora globispora TaxID=1450148 RepID=A0A317K007_9ACTN|nr:hypothetical protein [Micromonospora globispora]PWU46018.1 hypothetical protein DLJ46_19420 [Micromonospora globispora]PWU57422.1 hypothetical protein DLE60_24575 [Micromonospora globispora]RQW82102.1 hypothetical protein DKL51_33780 [Micromonospora globispora]
MSENTRTTGGFLGDPEAALAVTGSDSCCGSPAQAVGSILPPAAETATAGPCCGTQEAAEAAGSCCGTQARADAVAAGQGCCG